MLYLEIIDEWEVKKKSHGWTFARLIVNTYVFQSFFLKKKKNLQMNYKLFL